MTDKLMAVFEALAGQPRLLIEAELKPVQGDRFQPTGFPDLGAATYKRPNADGTSTLMLLVESAQSMANRMEAVCWDEAKNRIAAPLANLPHVVVDLGEGLTTSSIQEAHRLNSIYIISDKPFREAFVSEIKQMSSGHLDLRSLAAVVFKVDPCSLLHGLFLARKDIAGGRARLQRLLSSFIEARNVNTVASGGVKNERIDPSGADAHARYAKLDGTKEEKDALKKSLDAAKNVPYARTEYAAETICAYFNFDLAAMRGYGLGDAADRLLIALSLYKLLKLLSVSLRLRTACDLEVHGLKVTRPRGLELPAPEALLEELEEKLPALISACHFGDSPLTHITAPKVSKEALAKAKASMRSKETDSETPTTSPESVIAEEEDL
jgi:CRISPR-associated protein Csb1